MALTLNPSPRGTLNLAPLLPGEDAAGELFRNIVKTVEGPLNPPTLGDFEFMLPQSWGLGSLKRLPELTIFPFR